MMRSKQSVDARMFRYRLDWRGRRWYWGRNERMADPDPVALLIQAMDAGALALRYHRAGSPLLSVVSFARGIADAAGAVIQAEQDEYLAALSAPTEPEPTGEEDGMET
jgi:hypothetical protein